MKEDTTTWSPAEGTERECDPASGSSYECAGYTEDGGDAGLYPQIRSRGNTDSEVLCRSNTLG